jgi:hypothetical protein
MENKYKYLHSLFSDVAPPHPVESLQFWALQFDYDLTDIPNKLGVLVTYLEETVFHKVDVQILKTRSNFSIERNTAITGLELYPLIKHSVEMGNIHLQEAYLKFQIPVVKAPCPQFHDMMIELDSLANDLNK